MLILGIESTALTASVSLAKDDECVFLSSFFGTRKHSETLLPMLETAMRNCGHGMNDVDLIAVAAGPGSFTGVRIGVSMAKGLAFERKIPCMGVSSLASLARNLSGISGWICPVMDARRNQFYTALFRSDGNVIERRMPDSILPAEKAGEEIAGVLSSDPSPLYFVGDGYVLASRLLSPSGLSETPSLLRAPSAFSVTQVARDIWNDAKDRTCFTDETLVPVYLRPSQAEREADEKEKRPESLLSTHGIIKTEKEA